MAPLYSALDMSIGIIQSFQGPDTPSSFVISNADENSQTSPCSERGLCSRYSLWH